MSPSRLPHIILIILDTAGARRCSVYGHPRPTTPGLEALAREGVLYRYCFATAPWTIPSHLSLFSGLYASQLGLENHVAQVPEMFYTLPEVLSQLGYHTVGISCNGLVGHQRGFDVFYDMDTPIFSEAYHKDKLNTGFIRQASDRELGRLWLYLQYIFKNRRFLFPFQNVLDRFYKKHWGDLYEKTSRATERTFRLARYLVDKYQDRKPLFLFINLMETHWKYNPPLIYRNIIDCSPEERKELFQYDHQDFYIQDLPQEMMEKIYLLYEQGLYYIDKKLFDFYCFLEARGLKDSTLLLVTSDHGEALGEHGLWGHMFGLYNEILHVPLIIKYPRGVAAPGENFRLTQLSDLFATILEVAEAPLPPPDSSRSLLSASRDYALAEHYHNVGLEAIRKRVPDFAPRPVMRPCRCLIDADWFKLIEYDDGRLEFFDLKRDFEELHDLSGLPEHAPHLETMRLTLEEKLGPFPQKV